MNEKATVRLQLAEAIELCSAAARVAGACEETAMALARSAVDAEASGQPGVGLSHFLDYLDAIHTGRLDGRARPKIDRPAPAMIRSDAQGGAAHTGYLRALPDLVETARSLGIALFSQHNAFTCGALGWFVRPLAEEGLVGLAATNASAFVAAGGASRPVYSTNPLAFAAPVAGEPPLLIDQASSATAFVNIRRAAEAGGMIPEGWAVDVDGVPTTDPAAAMKGALLAFGGARGGNIALMVEVLSAGLTGANWSLDAPAFDTGGDCPRVGLLVVAIAPALLGDDFPIRLARQLERLETLGVHIPGRAGHLSRERTASQGIEMPRAIHALLTAANAAPQGRRMK